MKTLSRRGTLKLASSFFAASAPFPRRRSKAGRSPGPARRRPFSRMASFTGVQGAGASARPDAAFAKDLAAISKSAADADKAGRPVPIVLNLEKNAAYKIKRPLLFKQLSRFELNGNGAQLINTTRGSRHC